MLLITDPMTCLWQGDETRSLCPPRVLTLGLSSYAAYLIFSCRGSTRTNRHKLPTIVFMHKPRDAQSNQEATYQCEPRRVVRTDFGIRWDKYATRGAHQLRTTFAFGELGEDYKCGCNFLHTNRYNPYARRTRCGCSRRRSNNMLRFRLFVNLCHLSQRGLRSFSLHRDSEHLPVERPVISEA